MANAADACDDADPGDSDRVHIEEQRKLQALIARMLFCAELSLKDFAAPPPKKRGTTTDERQEALAATKFIGGMIERLTTAQTDLRHACSGVDVVRVAGRVAQIAWVLGPYNVREMRSAVLYYVRYQQARWANERKQERAQALKRQKPLTEYQRMLQDRKAAFEAEDAKLRREGIKVTAATLFKELGKIMSQSALDRLFQKKYG